MHSSELNVSGKVEKRAEAMSTGRVEVKVVPCSLQACSRWFVFLAEKVREWKLLRVGGMMLEPDQRLVGLGDVETGGVAKGRRASRLGSRGVLAGRTMALVRGGGFEERAARKSRWNTIPDAPSPSE